jgi:hypothetical protein
VSTASAWLRCVAASGLSAYPLPQPLACERFASVALERASACASAGGRDRAIEVSSAPFGRSHVFTEVKARHPVRTAGMAWHRPAPVDKAVRCAGYPSDAGYPTCKEGTGSAAARLLQVSVEEDALYLLRAESFVLPSLSCNASATAAMPLQPCMPAIVVCEVRAVQPRALSCVPRSHALSHNA